MPRKTNPNSPLGIKVQIEVLALITQRPRTTRSLQIALERPYHTVRQAVLELVDTGQITSANDKGRDTVYRISDGTVPSNKLIPVFYAGKDPYKLTSLLGARNNKEMKAATSVWNIPMHIARIFKAAQGIEKGNVSRKLSLPKIRLSMEHDLQALEQSVAIYKQILKNEKIWNPETLKKFPYDTDWDENEVNAAYTHYFPNG